MAGLLHTATGTAPPARLGVIDGEGNGRPVICFGMCCADRATCEHYLDVEQHGDDVDLIAFCDRVKGVRTRYARRKEGVQE